MGQLVTTLNPPRWAAPTPRRAGQHVQRLRWTVINTRVIRETSILLPGDEDDLDIVDSMPRDGDTVADRLIGGDTWARGTLTKVTIARSRITSADLSSTRLSDVKWDRCVLRGCTLIGANLTGGTFKNVIFDNCRLDYAAIDQVHAAGPVAFLGCALTATTFSRCTLNTAIFDGCKLAATRFDSTDLRGADLRGNDLSTIAGIPTMRGIIISEQQLPGITEALVRDLAMTVRAQ